jgi:hypothetical protein
MSDSGDYVFGSGNKLVSDIQGWARNPAANRGWFLISDAEQNLGTARHFGSSESANPPQLLIEFGLPVQTPVIRRIRRDSANFVFEIDGVPGWFYNIQTSENAGEGVWSPITDAPAGAALFPIVVAIPMTNSHLFFRAFQH